jgi:hypothetical protein
MIVYTGQPPICRAMESWTLFMMIKLPLYSGSGLNGWELGVLGAAIRVASVTIHVHKKGVVTCRM